MPEAHEMRGQLPGFEAAGYSGGGALWQGWDQWPAQVALPILAPSVAFPREPQNLIMPTRVSVVFWATPGALAKL